MSKWTESTWKEYERHILSYEAACRRDGVGALGPGEEWLAGHLSAKRLAHGKGAAQRHARAVGCFFRRNGVADLTDGVPVRAVLRAPDDFDASSLDLSNIPFDLGRAQAFANDSLCTETLRSYTLAARGWRHYAKPGGFNPREPTPHYVEAYLELYAVGKAFSSVRNMRNALSHYFRQQHIADYTREPGVERLLDELKRTKPPKSVPPFTPVERRQLIDALEERGAGIRDRVIVLLIAFSPMRPERLTLIETENIRFADKGIYVGSIHGFPEYFVGGHPDRALDIVTWMQALLEIAPGKGPLFRAVNARTFGFTKAESLP